MIPGFVTRTDCVSAVAMVPYWIVYPARSISGVPSVLP